MVAKINFNISANGHWEQTWQVTNAGVPLDITGYQFRLHIRDGKGPNSLLFLALTTEDGSIAILDAANGQIGLDIEPQTSILKTTHMPYDLLAIKDGKNYIWLEGIMTFDPGVTY